MVGFEDFDGGAGGFEYDAYVTVVAVITRTEEGDDRAAFWGAGGFELEEIAMLVSDALGYVSAVAVGPRGSTAVEVDILQIADDEGDTLTV